MSVLAGHTVMADEDLQRAGFHSSNSARWSPNSHVYPHSHHGTPAQEYSGFNFGQNQGIVDGSNYAANITQHQRPLHPAQQQHHIPPLVMPPWPSMLATQSAPGYHATFVPSAQPMPPLSATPTTTPSSAISARSISSTPRKTLTDLDRKRMCQYHEDHPGSKQTEIGAIFGVERSTVSKVLRQKEKYLFQDDGSRSPIKRTKGRSPDIERALAVWAKNQEKKGLPLTDELIRDKARAFAATTAKPDNDVAFSTSWLEKFKLNNNLMGARSRKSSLAPDETDSMATNSPQATSATSPISPMTNDNSPPVELQHVRSRESLKVESPESGSGLFKQQSYLPHTTTSFSGAFTDTVRTPFSTGPMSPSISPFFATEIAVSSALPSPTGTTPTQAPIASNSPHRPRSQTFPLLDQYLLSGTTGEVLTPKYVLHEGLDSPMEGTDEISLSVAGILRVDSSHDQESVNRPQTVSPAETMRPPPLPATNNSRDRKRSTTPATSSSSALTATSHEEARNALQVVLSFFQQQPVGFLDLQESVTLGKLMEKLKLPG